MSALFLVLFSYVLFFFFNDAPPSTIYTLSLRFSFFFFFNDTATTEIYTVSLHDALPISQAPLPAPAGPGHRTQPRHAGRGRGAAAGLAGTVPAAGQVLHAHHEGGRADAADQPDRKSTRLNSSHTVISYAVFCLQKKKTPHAAERDHRLQRAAPGGDRLVDEQLDRRGSHAHRILREASSRPHQRSARSVEDRGRE